MHKHGWSYHIIECEWKGFGTKLIETYNFLKGHPEIDRFVFCDAYDVVAMGGPDEFEKKINNTSNIILSAEKGLWPPLLHPFKIAYPKFDHGFNYINSGCYYAKSSSFIELVEEYPLSNDFDDQFWLNMCWLISEKEQFTIDFNQKIFNSHSFIGDNEYGYENGRVQFKHNQPVFIHSNGRSVDEKLVFCCGVLSADW